ncbi:MAG TPA: DedA family protein [Oligoflexia bacterium]|nr:DedA family protein [Oligoflexia bacterium]HMR24708.1 DedA family protein [Oligoflexia bacterium]
MVSGVGIPIPEEIPLLFLSVLYYQERLSSPLWIALAIIAISVADFGLYSIGKYLGFKIFKHPFLKRNFNENTMHKVSHYIHRYGYKVIILGRLLLGVRSAIFLSSGILRMPRNKFIMYDLIASLISVSIFMLLSTLLLKRFDGELDQVQQFIQQYQSSLTLVALTCIGCIILLALFFRFFKKNRSSS